MITGRVVAADGTPVPDLKINGGLLDQQTDSQGRFTLRGRRGGNVRVSLSNTSDWLFVKGDPWATEIPAGTTDAHLVVHRSARVTFRANLRGLSVFDYFLEPASGKGPTIRLPLQLSQRVMPVPPGHWNFIVRGDGNELLRLPDLRAEGGVDTHDARFAPFDVRSFAVPVDIMVRDSKGQPIDDCLVSMRIGADADSFRIRQQPNQGVVHLLVPKDGVYVDVEPADRSLPTIELGKIREDRVVALLMPVLAAGCVVTADGKPVSDLAYSIDSQNVENMRLDFSGRTDGSGDFVARGVAERPIRTVRIDIAPDWCFVEGHPWRTELAAGTNNARMVVQKAARVRFASDMKERALGIFEYRLYPASGSGEHVKLGFDLHQAELLVPPGHWHFAVHGGSKELLRLPDLRTESGIETHDPRFMEFDWRAYATCVDIRVHNEEGQPMDRCEVILEDSRYIGITSPKNGVAHLLVPKDGIQVKIRPLDANMKRLPEIDLGMVKTDQSVELD